MTPATNDAAVQARRQTLFDKVATHLLTQMADVMLAVRLQAIHDNFEPYQWTGSLAKIAKEYNLTLQTVEANLAAAKEPKL